jgi:hypothetical protein
LEEKRNVAGVIILDHIRGRNNTGIVEKLDANKFPGGDTQCSQPMRRSETTQPPLSPSGSNETRALESVKQGIFPD